MATIDLDDFRERMNQVRRNAEKLDGTHEVPLSELFSPAFMRQHTSVPEFEVFCRDAGFDTSSKTWLAEMPLERLDAAARRLTEFATWEDMKKAAAADWATRCIFDDLSR